MRYLNREENPDVDEIIRRYQSDRKDFATLPFDYEIINNNNLDDLGIAIDTILAAAKEFNGQKWLKKF